MKFFRMTAILFVLLLAWVGQPAAFTNVSGSIENATWTQAGSPYILIGQTTVVAERTLTILPGVVVKSEGPGLRIAGTLIADGTPAEPIVFTSMKDDSFGGDTNGDGGATTPARGNWGYLWFSETSTNNVLNHVMIRYGGGNGSHSLIVDTSSLIFSNSIVEESGVDGINITGASPTITGNTIRNNSNHGIWVSSSNATITNNTISGNGTEGVWAGASSAATITGNTISMNSNSPIFLEASALNSVISGNILFGNGMGEVIGLRGETSAATTWGSLNAPYVVASSQLTVGLGATVTILPGVVVKFAQQALVVHGTLIADGTPEQPIVFTSINDHSFGGDTNGNGAATPPAPGDWGFLRFMPTSTNNVLNHVMIRYAGRESNESLMIETPSLSLNNSTVEEGFSSGIYAGAATSIMGSVIRNNGHHGILLSDSNATIVNSTIIGNASDGVFNATSLIVVNAKNNYWGDPSGPYDPSNDPGGWYNPIGTGNRVSDYVDYTPWLGYDPNLRLSGTIYVEGTSTPIPGATLSLGSYSTTTNSNGYYAFDKIPSGNYALDASKDGFLNYSTMIDVTTYLTRDIFLSRESDVPMIAINGGAAYTTILNASLTLSAPDMESGVSQMRFTKDGIIWTDWELYGTSKPWILTSGNGIRTVYVQFQDGAGNPSGIFSDTILLQKFLVNFDGDNKSDMAFYRPGTGGWWSISSKDGSFMYKQWGDPAEHDTPVPGDYDGDGKTDVAVYRVGNGGWYIIPSSTPGAPYGVGWGGDASDLPIPGDYDGDGKTDVAVYRVSNGGWYIIPSSAPGAPYGVGWGGDASDIPVPGDYDGDGKTDVAVYRVSNGGWYIIPSSTPGAPYGVGWGGDVSDIPVPGDYDGDGKTDVAVYRASSGAWYVIPSSKPGAPYGIGWGGGASDIPVPGDYDGDGKTDIAIYRAATGSWYIIPSSGAAPYGVGWEGDGTDLPLTTNPASYM